MSQMSGGEKRGTTPEVEKALDQERFELLGRLDDWLETPMLVLAFV